MENRWNIQWGWYHEHSTYRFKSHGGPSRWAGESSLLTDVSMNSKDSHFHCRYLRERTRLPSIATIKMCCQKMINFMCERNISIFNISQIHTYEQESNIITKPLAKVKSQSRFAEMLGLRGVTHDAVSHSWATNDHSEKIPPHSNQSIPDINPPDYWNWPVQPNCAEDMLLEKSFNIGMTTSSLSSRHSVFPVKPQAQENRILGSESPSELSSNEYCTTNHSNATSTSIATLLM